MHLSRQADFSWTTESIERCRDDNIDSLEVHGTQHILDRLDKIGEIASLRRLSISSSFGVDISKISRLSDLEELSVCAPIIGDIDFGWYPNLKRLFITWPKQTKGIRHLRHLTHFSAGSIPQTELNLICESNELLHLKINSGRINSLAPLAHLQKLETLSIALCTKISDWSPLANLCALNLLNIEACRALQSMDFSRDMNDLKKVFITPNIGHCDWKSYCWPVGALHVYLPNCSTQLTIEELRSMFPAATFIKIGKALSRTGT